MMIILRGVLLREMVGLEGSTVCLKFDLYPCRKNQRCYLRSSLGGHTYSRVNVHVGGCISFLTVQLESISFPGTPHQQCPVYSNDMFLSRAVVSAGQPFIIPETR